MKLGVFSQKSTFIKICLLFYPSYTLPSSAERRAGEDRANSDSTLRQQKVLFVKIAPSPHLSCFCQWSGKYPPFPLVTPEYPDHPSLHYSLLDGVPSRVSQFPPTICLVLGVNSPNISHLWLCSRGYPREKSPSPPEKSL
jgi:hypothetical protein